MNGKQLFFSCVLALLTLACSAPATAATLHVGAASISITPDKPIALCGQMHTRIGRTVESPVQANALAMESRSGDEVLDQAIFVASGVVYIPPHISARAREVLAEQIPDFDVQKLILSGTHTHTGPVMLEGKYSILDDDVMLPKEYSEYFAQRIAEAATAAWNNRIAAKAGWGMGDAVIGYNRRSYFEDGHGQMYGDISIDTFRGIEGPEDHAVESLFFWDENDQLIATAINIVCPAQEVEGRSEVNADFWHPVRESLKKKYGDGLVVLGWIGAAGDQSPHIRYRKAAEDRMRRLRGLDRLDEIARRIVRAWEESYEGAQKEKFDDIPMVHVVKPIELPRRLVTEKEYNDLQQEIETYSKDPKNSRRVVWSQAALRRYERQQEGPLEPYIMELHALRLGDIAITTNDFELYTQYGIQMKSKSKALHTFVIQLAGPGTYVATPEAIAGGGYSAIVQSNEVGSEGGQVLVDETVAAVNTLWQDK